MYTVCCRLQHNSHALGKGQKQQTQSGWVSPSMHAFTKLMSSLCDTHTTTLHRPCKAQLGWHHREQDSIPDNHILVHCCRQWCAATSRAWHAAVMNYPLLKVLKVPMLATLT